MSITARQDEWRRHMSADSVKSGKPYNRVGDRRTTDWGACLVALATQLPSELDVAIASITYLQVRTLYHGQVDCSCRYR